MKELLDVLKTIPKRKSPGPDGLPYEVYTRYSSVIAPYLLDTFNHCLKYNLSLPGSESSFVTTLFKKGDRCDLANWRPIALSNADSKILSKLLTNRLNQIGLKCFSKFQYGFLSG